MISQAASIARRSSGAPQVAILTCGEEPALFGEETGLLPAFARQGVEAQAVLWDAFGAGDPAAFDLVLFRSTWDYFERIPEFRAFLDRLEQTPVKVLNPLPLVRWNLDKAYLLELGAHGVPIVPTRHFLGPAPIDLGAVMDQMGWSRAIVKPAISGGAFRTHLIARDNASLHDAEATALSAESGVLVQPYLEQITSDGEWSLVFFAGRFSHAVIKTPQADEFRVQLHFGGSFRRAEPTPAILERAQAVIASLPHPPVYARVDGVVLGAAGLHLMEVELIEPYLYFAAAPEAMEIFVSAVAQAAFA